MKRASVGFLRIREVMACLKTEGKEAQGEREVVYEMERRDNSRGDGSQEGKGSRGQVEELEKDSSMLTSVIGTGWKEARVEGWGS